VRKCGRDGVSLLDHQDDREALDSMKPALAIETTGVTRHFGAIAAVDDLNLRVPAGSVYGFLGPNGAGKTTTIRMLLSLIRPDHGDIHLLGNPLTSTTKRAQLRRIGAMVEAPSLYPHLTGEENLRVTQGLIGLDKSQISRVLGIVHLTRDAKRRVQTYSQGMRQRLGIALALLARPELLILDEPTNGLDPAGIHEMRDLIRGFPAEHGITVFLSSHLLAEVEQIATHVGIIGRGHLLLEGTLAALRQRQRRRVIVAVDQPTRAHLILHRAGWRVERTDRDDLTLDLEDRTDTSHVAASLVNAGISLYELRTEQQSLEDLFLDLTRTSNLAAPEPIAEMAR
jgi:ABC-2 type transport system ATP-binding protein